MRELRGTPLHMRLGSKTMRLGSKTMRLGSKTMQCTSASVEECEKHLNTSEAMPGRECKASKAECRVHQAAPHNRKRSKAALIERARARVRGRKSSPAPASLSLARGRKASPAPASLSLARGRKASPAPASVSRVREAERVLLRLPPYR